MSLPFLVACQLRRRVEKERQLESTFPSTSQLANDLVQVQMATVAPIDPNHYACTSPVI